MEQKNIYKRTKERGEKKAEDMMKVKWKKIGLSYI